ncbi:MAG: NTP transferase domain-containing protein [Clostridia bacterium]|nr:NTP transferase domain-containing protein [Clostridia bacterium]
MIAVIMCGGIGSRLRPITESMPKPMVRILNRPVLDIIIEKLIMSGISEIYLSLGYMASEIIEYCENKKYNASINFFIETAPLGTAGGVKNCIKKTDDDVLVLSGDNIFDFDLKRIYDYHVASDSDITVCGINVTDPREYGVIVCDADGSISSFIEKPTWEQADGNLVNTGIYILKGKIIDMIPENRFYDFSENLFPEVFKSDLRFMCYDTKGYWGDMGEFSAYLKITKDILDRKFQNFIFNNKFYDNDTVLENGVTITAPCLIGENVKIGKGSFIGPFCVISDNCEIGENCNLEGVVLGNGCSLGSHCDMKYCIAADCVKVSDNCSIEENSVFAYGCTIGRFSRILTGSRIWPGRRIEAESVVSGDMFYETPSSIEFDIFGISGKINSQFTVSDAAKLGQAVASLKEIEKIGVGCDGKECSNIYRDLIMAGIRTCGKFCYDFSDMFKLQSYFYSAYCSLDAFVYVSTSGDVLNISFFGKYGMPVSSRTARQINNNFRFSSFNFGKNEEYKEIYNLKLFSTVYESYFRKLCGKEQIKLDVYLETENKHIQELFKKNFARSNKENRNTVQVLINSGGTDMYIIENEKFYSSDRILALLCEIELADGKTVIIPEEAPSFIEEIAEKYDSKVIRVFDCNPKNELPSKEDILNNIWCFDPVMMFAKLINIMNSADISLMQLFEYQKDFALRKSIIEFEGEPSLLRNAINNCGAERHGSDIYYILEKRNGKARLRQMGNANRIRLLVEAVDMESAKEIAVFISEKIKNGNIDKGNQKL